MNTVEKLSPADQLLSFTQEMLLSAKAGDWETLTRLEKARLPLLDQVFSQGVADKVELAREILSIDEKTKCLAKAEMPVIQNELLKIKNSGKASVAYQAVHDFTSSHK